MREIIGDLFSQECDAICITTSGIVNRHGQLIMGAGCALEAKNRWPKLPFTFGELLALNGNIPVIIKKEFLFESSDSIRPYDIISFPTKNHWLDKSGLDLIVKSCAGLMNIVAFHGIKKVVLPRPGCGCGGLDWQKVKNLISPILDDRIYIISNGK